MGLLCGVILLFDLQTGEIRARLVAHTERVPSLAFGADGRHLVSASWDGDVRLWGLDVFESTASELVASREVAGGMTPGPWTRSAVGEGCPVDPYLEGEASDPACPAGDPS